MKFQYIYYFLFSLSLPALAEMGDHPLCIKRSTSLDEALKILEEYDRMADDEGMRSPVGLELIKNIKLSRGCTKDIDSWDDSCLSPFFEYYAIREPDNSNTGSTMTDFCDIKVTIGPSRDKVPNEPVSSISIDGGYKRSFGQGKNFRVYGEPRSPGASELIFVTDNLLITIEVDTPAPPKRCSTSKFFYHLQNLGINISFYEENRKYCRIDIGGDTGGTDIIFSENDKSDRATPEAPYFDGERQPKIIEEKDIHKMLFDPRAIGV